MLRLVKEASMFLLLVSLMACGTEGPIAPGLYAVEILYEEDTWPGSKKGSVSQAQWRLKELDDGKYSLLIVGTSFVYTGKVSGDKIRFVQERRGDNCFKHVLWLEMVANDSPDFVGKGTTKTTIGCGTEVLKTKVVFTGDYLEEL